MVTDIDRNDVVDEHGVKAWEECLLIDTTDPVEKAEKLAALNSLLVGSFYIYESYPVGDNLFIRLRDINNGESE